MESGVDRAQSNPAWDDCSALLDGMFKGKGPGHQYSAGRYDDAQVVIDYLGG
jgi:hypothetical protein